MRWSSRQVWQLRKRSSPPPCRRRPACSAPSRWDFQECAYRCDSQAVSRTSHMPYLCLSRRSKLLSCPDRTAPAHKVLGLVTKEKKLRKRSVSLESLLCLPMIACRASAYTPLRRGPTKSGTIHTIKSKAGLVLFFKSTKSLTAKEFVRSRHRSKIVPGVAAILKRFSRQQDR